MIIFDGKLNPKLHAPGMSNFDSLNVQIGNVSNIAELELSCAKLANNLILKPEKIYENLRVLIINGFEKLTLPCELMDKKGYRIVKEVISRVVFKTFLLIALVRLFDIGSNRRLPCTFEQLKQSK